MAKELRVDKFCTGIAFTYELKEKLMLKFSKPGESFPAVVRRVCEKLVKNVKLPKSVVEEIDRKTSENYRKRMARRAERAALRSVRSKYA